MMKKDDRPRVVQRIETEITGKNRAVAIAQKKKELQRKADRVMISIDDMKYRKEKEFDVLRAQMKKKTMVRDKNTK